MLLATRTAVGLVGIASETMGASQDITVLTTSVDVDPYYLCRTLMGRTDLMQRSARGTSIQGVSRGDVDSLPIPIPPMPKQRAIAEALSDVDDLISSLDALIAKKRAIKQAAMQQLLTGQDTAAGVYRGVGDEAVGGSSGHQNWCNAKHSGHRLLEWGNPMVHPDGHHSYIGQVSVHDGTKYYC